MSQFTNHDLLAMEKELYDTSFYHFSKYCLGYSDLSAKTHGPIARAIQADTKRKMICVPRGCFKSSISTVSYPLWILPKNPNLRILIDSEIYTNAKNFLREIKGHIKSNQKYLQFYGDTIKGLTVDNEAEIIIGGRTKPLKEPTIACSGIGAGKTSQHYDVIIADDLSSYQNCINPDLAKKTIDHYRQYISLLEPNGIIIVIGTRYSENDIIGFIMENELGIQNGDIAELKKRYCEQIKTNSN